MALQVSFPDPYGASAHTAAYAMITELSMSSSPSTDAGYHLAIGISIYHNAAARSKDDVAAIKSNLGSYSFSVAADSSAFTTFFAETVLDDADKTLLKQAYAYIKTQTSPVNFTSATDV